MDFIKKSFLKKIQYFLGDWLAAFVCLVFILISTIVSLHRFWQYSTFFYDFGIFDQAIWRLSRFQAPVIDHYVIGGKWIFADHFNPSIFLLAPFYWITNRQEIILVVQAVMVGLSGLILYRLGKKVLNEDILPLAILITYFCFIGLQNAVITDFHPVTILVLPLMLAFWSITNNRHGWYWIFLLICLGIKENEFLLGVGIGLFLIFYERNWRKTGFLTILISSLWGFLAIKLVIPYFAQRAYQYHPVLPRTFLGKMLAFVDHPIKRKTLFYSFASFDFLPLLFWPFWPLVFQDFLVRFAAQEATNRWGLAMHYSMPLAAILAISSLYCLAWIIKQWPQVLSFKRLVAALLVVNALFLHQFVLHGPLALAYNRAFFQHTKSFAFLDDLVRQIPSSASVMTQNNLAVRFTHQKVYLLRVDYAPYNPDYVVIDNRQGQNANNFFNLNPGEINKLVNKLKNDQKYSLIYHQDEQYIFQNKSETIEK